MAMEAVSTSETSVNFYETTRRSIPENSYPHTRRRENLKSHKVSPNQNSRMSCFYGGAFLRSSTRLEIRHLFWCPKVHYCVHKNPPSTPNLSHMNPIHIPKTISQRTVLILSSHLHLSLPRVVFPTQILYSLSTPPCILHTPPISSSFL
jgi:hypothetical protein